LNSLEFLRRYIKDKFRKQKRFIYIVIFGLIVLGGNQIPDLYTQVTGRSLGINLEQVELASAPRYTRIEGGIYHFDRRTLRIDCQIVATGALGLAANGRVLVKWYYGSEQLTSHYIGVKNDNPIVVWLEPGYRKSFRPGKYTVEIYLNKTLVKTIEFEIE